MDNSIQIDTNGVFLKKNSKTNPRTKYLKKGLRTESTIQVVWKQFGFINHNLKQIHGLGFTNLDLWFVCKDSFLCMVLKRFMRIFKIRENRLNLLKILRICGQESNQTFWNSGFVDHDTNQTFLKLWNCDINLLEGRICVHDLMRIHRFVRWIHGYTIPWYNSRNLKKYQEVTNSNYFEKYQWRINLSKSFLKQN